MPRFVTDSRPISAQHPITEQKVGVNRSARLIPSDGEVD